MLGGGVPSSLDPGHMALHGDSESTRADPDPSQSPVVNYELRA